MSFTILNQPYDVRTTVGLTASFFYSVIDPSGTITYQWVTDNHRIALLSGFQPLPGAEVDGMWMILGATLATYTTPALISADNGSQFQCWVVDTQSVPQTVGNLPSNVIQTFQNFSSRCAVLQVH